MHVNVILNDVKYTATIPISKLISISKNKYVIKEFSGVVKREDGKHFYGTLYFRLNGLDKAISGLINDDTIHENGIGFIALEANSKKEIRLPSVRPSNKAVKGLNEQLHTTSNFKVLSDPQPGDHGWLGYGDNGELNGGAVGRYDSNNILGGIREEGIITIWFPVWIDPNYDPIPDDTNDPTVDPNEELTILYAKVWAGDDDINFGSPTPTEKTSSVSYSFTVTVGYGGISVSVTVSYNPYKVEEPEIGRDLYGRAYINWPYINVGEDVSPWWWPWPVIEYPYLADHRLPDSAFGMISAWVHAEAGASQGYHTCYVKFKFDWRYFDYWFGTYLSGSTNWMIVSFKVYVYW